MAVYFFVCLFVKKFNELTCLPDHHSVGLDSFLNLVLFSGYHTLLIYKMEELNRQANANPRRSELRNEISAMLKQLYDNIDSLSKSPRIDLTHER